MKKKFIIATISLTAAFIVSLVVYSCNRISPLLSLCITLGTFTYHFLMRLAVGTVINIVMNNKADPSMPWFSPKSFEKKLYRLLRVRRWKAGIPTYDPSLFSAEKHSYEEIAGAMCQAEVVHEVIMLLSFVPVLFIIPFGSPAVFIITSVLAALYDSLFVILQRYNRPKILRLIKHQKRSKS